MQQWQFFNHEFVNDNVVSRFNVFDDVINVFDDIVNVFDDIVNVINYSLDDADDITNFITVDFITVICSGTVELHIEH